MSLFDQQTQLAIMIDKNEYHLSFHYINSLKKVSPHLALFEAGFILKFVDKKKRRIRQKTKQNKTKNNKTNQGFVCKGIQKLKSISSTSMGNFALTYKIPTSHVL